MKKIILFLMLIFMVGCSAMDADKVKDPSLIEGSANSEVVSSTDSAQEGPIENADSSEQYKYSDNEEINDFLNDVNPTTPTDITEVDIPQDISSVGTAVINMPLPEKTNDLLIYSQDDPINIYEIADTVSANRTALIAALAPFMDGGNIGFFSLGEAENFLNCAIKWARNTGITVPDTSYTRMYTVFKSEVGGYIFIFFDYDINTGNNILKFMLYVDQIYDTKTFSDIQIGDSMEKVAKIDKSTALTNSEIEKLPTYKFYYLDTGVLFITYDENKIIIDMKYLDYEFPNLNQNSAGDPSRNYNLTILPQDLPPAS